MGSELGTTNAALRGRAWWAAVLLALAFGALGATAAAAHHTEGGTHAAATGSHATAPAHAAAAGPMPSPDAVLTELEAGNKHHVSHAYTHPHETVARLHELVGAQHPHAVILSCSDSRVPPEIVFDQGLGDLFSIRVAGNIAGDAEIASIEYAAEHLHTPLVVVMGHQSCGAVAAAIAGGEAPGHLPTLVKAIAPAVARAKTMPGDLSANAVRANVEMVVAQLRASQPVLAEMVSSGKLRIVGAVYSLETGAVTWLP